MAFYVFDLDGTLADLTHRLHFIQGETKDWDGFFAACGMDGLIRPAIDLLLNLTDGDHRVEIWSGRSDAVRKETERWLWRRAKIPPAYLTRMRKAGDHRPDHVIKREFLTACDARPDVIFDDRKQVVDMWRREGIACFQVADGEF
jgi:phosphoglycolate phosphatase-like HAD superfamily hydrolase